MKTTGFVLLLIAAAVVGSGSGYLVGNARSVASAPKASTSGSTTRTATSTGPGGQVTTSAPSSGSGQQGTGAFGAGALAGGVTAGTVQKVAGNVITLTATGGSTVTVNVSGTTSVQKTGQGTVADITAGATVTVIGATQSDGSISATSVSIGGGSIGSRLGQLPVGGGTGGATGGLGGRQGGGGFGAGGGGGFGAGGGGVSGTVQSVQGNIISITQRDGTLAKATIGASTAIEKTVQGSINDIVTGGSVIVIGAKSSDGSISATNITIMQNPGA